METITLEQFEKNDTDILVVKFEAGWCLPCKVIKESYKEYAEKNKDKAKFFVVDTDLDPEFMKSFGIRSIPTIIVKKYGKIELIHHGIPFINISKFLNEMLSNIEISDK